MLTDTLGIDGYKVVGKDFYESVREAVRIAGVDLDTYARRSAAPLPTPSPSRSP